MATLRAAEDYYRTQALLAVAAQRQARREWSQVRPEAISAWNPVRLAQFVAAAQLTAAKGADTYTDAALAEQGIDIDRTGTVNPVSFAGVAGDGRPLVTLLDEPRIGALTAIGQGLAPAVALARAGTSLQVMALSAVQDAGRGAGGTALLARPRADGWVRMLQLPSCSRCVVLAGKMFRYNTGFPRHPRCDCRHVPTSEDIAGDLTTDPRAAIESGQVTGLSKADRRAIVDDGADPGQVINARRGMTTQAGRKATTARARGGIRLRPEAIYAEAEGRADAIRLLKRFGYLT